MGAAPPSIINHTATTTQCVTAGITASPQCIHGLTLRTIAFKVCATLRFSNPTSPTLTCVLVQGLAGVFAHCGVWGCVLIPHPGTKDSRAMIPFVVFSL